MKNTHTQDFCFLPSLLLPCIGCRTLENSLFLNGPFYLLPQARTPGKYSFYTQLLLALVLKYAQNPAMFNHHYLSIYPIQAPSLFGLL